MQCCVTQGGGKESPPRGGDTMGEARGVSCWGKEGSEQDHGVALQNQAKPKLPLAALATLFHQTKPRRCLQQGKSQRLNERGKGREALQGTGNFTGPNTPQATKAKKVLVTSCCTTASLRGLCPVALRINWRCSRARCTNQQAKGNAREQMGEFRETRPIM